MALLIFIVILVVLIWVHELGHFSVAKFFGVRVDEFSIGFPPRIFSRVWRGTRYSFGLLLVGGYVKIFGEDGNPSTGSGQARDPRSLASKNRGVQAAVLLAGIVFNLIFAWLAISASYMVGVQSSLQGSDYGQVTDAAVVVLATVPGSPAEVAGFKPGDKIDTVQTATAVLTPGVGSGGAEVRDFIQTHADESLIFSVHRGAETKNLLVRAVGGIEPNQKVIGIRMDDVGTLKLPPHLALVQGAVAFKNMTVMTAQGLAGFLGQLVVGRADFSQVAGPIGIAGVGSTAVKSGFSAAAIIAALISINLALINLLPIPGLDGGRLLVVAIEAIIRRPVNPRVTNALLVVGLMLIVALMVAVSISDIRRLLG